MDWDSLLKTAPTVAFTGNTKRAVAQLTFNKKNDYLFVSGRRNRCNPMGVFCIYMAEDRATALAEYDKYYTDIADDQPFVVYTGALKARALLDLTDRASVKHFGLSNADFFDSFRTKTETNLEMLGAAVSRQSAIAGIRFPSDARHAKKKQGNNIVVFRDSLVVPDSLVIKGPAKEVLDRWPK